MTAGEREQNRAAHAASAVPMHRLLASCAAADAVSTPPSPEETQQQDVPRPARPAFEGTPDQDAA